MGKGLDPARRRHASAGPGLAVRPVVRPSTTSGKPAGSGVPSVTGPSRPRCASCCAGCTGRAGISVSGTGRREIRTGVPTARELREQLRVAVEAENFELAAELRDRLRVVETPSDRSESPARRRHALARRQRRREPPRALDPDPAGPQPGRPAIQSPVDSRRSGRRSSREVTDVATANRLPAEGAHLPARPAGGDGPSAAARAAPGEPGIGGPGRRAARCGPGRHCWCRTGSASC